jgi:hypothetical protein
MLLFFLFSFKVKKQGGAVNCTYCNEELPERANYCFSCGFDLNPGCEKKETFKQNQDRQEVNLTEDYGGYLSVGGWLNIIAGVILALIFFNKASEGSSLNNGMILLGFAGFISGLIVAWLYFGLHKVILKISRIEKTLASMTSEKENEEIP